MFKSLSRKLAAVAAAFVLAAGAFGASAYAQHNPYQLGAVVEVAPGTRQCITSSMQAYDSATADNFVMSGAPVKFTFFSLTGGPTFSSGSYPVFSYYKRLDRGSVTSFFGQMFPGYFRTCARNDSTEFSSVFLSVTVDQ